MIEEDEYYTSFIKNTIKELKINGICYVFHKWQVDEILKHIDIPVITLKNECGYTLRIDRGKRKYVRKESI